MFLLTNDRQRGLATLLSRYPLRTHVENSIREQVGTFHVDSLSSSVRLKVEMDMVLDVITSAAYRWFGREPRGWERATAGRLWTTFLDHPGKVRITKDEVIVRVRRFSRAPLLLDSPMVEENPPIPWLGGRRLRLEITGDLNLRKASGSTQMTSEEWRTTLRNLSDEELREVSHLVRDEVLAREAHRASEL